MRVQPVVPVQASLHSLYSRTEARSRSPLEKSSLELSRGMEVTPVIPVHAEVHPLFGRGASTPSSLSSTSAAYESRAELTNPMHVTPVVPHAPEHFQTQYRKDLIDQTFAPVDLTISVPVPPEFVRPLKDMAAVEGTRVVMEGLVQGRPTPNIKWFKEGRSLEHSPDFEITFRDGRVALTVPETFAEDAGLYRCEASNTAGRAASAARLTVTARTLAPRFEEGLPAHCRVREGQPMRLVVRVAGEPRPKVTWFRDGARIVSSPDFVLESVGEKEHALRIPEAFPDDAGRYSVKAENSAGEAVTSTQLHVGQASSAAPPEPKRLRSQTSVEMAAPAMQPEDEEEAEERLVRPSQLRKSQAAPWKPQPQPQPQPQPIRPQQAAPKKAAPWMPPAKTPKKPKFIKVRRRSWLIRVGDLSF